MFQKYLFIFLLAMVPMIELRGSIIFAVGWELDYFTALVISAIGNMLPVPIIYFFANGRSIRLSILYSNGTTLEDEGLVLKNLYDPSTAPAQIDAILAQWEGKW